MKYKIESLPDLANPGSKNYQVVDRIGNVVCGFLKMTLSGNVFLHGVSTVVVLSIDEVQEILYLMKGIRDEDTGK